MYLSKRPNQTLAIRKSSETEADFVPHLRIEEVQALAQHAQATARAGKGERDSLLIQTLFDGCFRVSEAIGLCPSSLVETPDGWVARIKGKGNKVAEVAISSSRPVSFWPMPTTRVSSGRSGFFR
jgi:site-specific recombinase XerD